MTQPLTPQHPAPSNRHPAPRVLVLGPWFVVLGSRVLDLRSLVVKTEHPKTQHTRPEPSTQLQAPQPPNTQLQVQGLGCLLLDARCRVLRDWGLGVGSWSLVAGSWGFGCWVLSAGTLVHGSWFLDLRSLVLGARWLRPNSPKPKIQDPNPAPNTKPPTPPTPSYRSKSGARSWVLVAGCRLLRDWGLSVVSWGARYWSLVASSWGAECWDLGPGR